MVGWNISRCASGLVSWRSNIMAEHDKCGWANLVLRHLPCIEMQFLRVASGNSLLEPIRVNHFSPRYKLCTEDDREPFWSLLTRLEAGIKKLTNSSIDQVQIVCLALTYMWISESEQQGITHHFSFASRLLICIEIFYDDSKADYWQQ